MPAARASDVIRDAQDIGALIRQHRRDQHLTQRQLADTANVSEVFLNEIEKGKPTAQLGRVLQVLAALGIDLIARPR